MGDDIKQWEIYDGYNIGYKNGKYYVDNNGELVELGGGSFQEAANIASIQGIQPTEPMGGGGGFTEKSDWERQSGHLKENRAYSKAIRQQRRLQRKNKKFNQNNIMGKFPIFRNGGIVRFQPGGETGWLQKYREARNRMRYGHSQLTDTDKRMTREGNKMALRTAPAIGMGFIGPASYGMGVVGSDLSFGADAAAWGGGADAMASSLGQSALGYGLEQAGMEAANAGILTGGLTQSGSAMMDYNDNKKAKQKNTTSNTRAPRWFNR